MNRHYRRQAIRSVFAGTLSPRQDAAIDTMPYTVTLSQSNTSFTNREGLTVLDEAINAGLVLSYSCKTGSCGVCKASLLEGQVTHGTQATAISKVELSQGKILTCCAYPQSDLLLDVEHIAELGKQQVLTLPCVLESVTRVSSEVMKVLLRIPPDSNFSSVPGQYIELIRGNIRRSYSISEMSGNLIELHVSYIPGGAISEFLYARAKPGALLHLEGPFGTFVVRNSPRKKLFVAGGTGAAPIVSMVETQARHDPDRQLSVYWGVRAGSLIYTDRLAWLGKHYKNVSFTPVVSGEDTSWTGRRGMVHEAVQADFRDLADYDVYACGPQAMIQAAESAFISQGLVQGNFFADVFLASATTGVQS